MAQANSTVTFRTYMVRVDGSQHVCTYIVTASSRMGAAAIAKDQYTQMYGTDDPATKAEVVNTIEPGGAYCIYDNYDDIDVEYPEV